jgi:hypothetical protein
MLPELITDPGVVHHIPAPDNQRVTHAGGEVDMLTSIRVTCHRCGHEKTYMGSKLALIETSRRPVRIKCSHCSASIRIDRNKPR